jgi:hypothetical protein
MARRKKPSGWQHRRAARTRELLMDLAHIKDRAGFRKLWRRQKKRQPKVSVEQLRAALFDDVWKHPDWSTVRFHFQKSYAYIPLRTLHHHVMAVRRKISTKLQYDLERALTWIGQPDLSLCADDVWATQAVDDFVEELTGSFPETPPEVLRRHIDVVASRIWGGVHAQQSLANQEYRREQLQSKAREREAAQRAANPFGKLRRP